MEQDEGPLCYRDLIPSELRIMIGRYIVEACSMTAVLFACTCKEEFNRYLRNVPKKVRLCYRELMFLFSDEEAHYTPNTDWVFPGERGYAYAKGRHEKSMVKIERTEFLRYRIQCRDKGRRKERQLQQKQWKKKIYDD